MCAAAGDWVTRWGLGHNAAGDAAAGADDAADSPAEPWEARRIADAQRRMLFPLRLEQARNAAERERKDECAARIAAHLAAGGRAMPLFSPLMHSKVGGLTSLSTPPAKTRNRSMTEAENTSA